MQLEQCTAIGEINVASISGSCKEGGYKLPPISRIKNERWSSTAGAELAMNAPAYAAGTLILWEYIITVDDEIDLFWNRYLTIALRMLSRSTSCDRRKPYPSDCLCRLILSPDSVVRVLTLTFRAIVTVQILVMEGILVLRLWAITGRRAFLLGFFCCLLFPSMAATLGIYFFHTTTAPVRLYNWLSMLLFEFIVFLTAVFYGVRGVKATKILTQVRENFGPKPMKGMLLRDSVFYFLMYITLALSLIKMSGSLKNCLAFSAASQSWHWSTGQINNGPQIHEHYNHANASQVA
ncbi:hypothetical protein EDD85DRAFT_795872 [Armillaria nabsnona]|nr:hypothetical protein EDD85DRAFT_795872 [Armillaria nabsnona]